MSRNAQLQVRLEESLRDQLQEFCQRNGITASGILYEVAKRLVSGELPLEAIQGQPSAPPNLEERISDLVAAEVAKQLAVVKQELSEPVAVAQPEPLGETAKGKKLEGEPHLLPQ